MLAIITSLIFLCSVSALPFSFFSSSSSTTTIPPPRAIRQCPGGQCGCMQCMPMQSCPNCGNGCCCPNGNGGYMCMPMGHGNCCHHGGAHHSTRHPFSGFGHHGHSSSSSDESHSHKRHRGHSRHSKGRKRGRKDSYEYMDSSDEDMGHRNLRKKYAIREDWYPTTPETIIRHIVSVEPKNFRNSMDNENGQITNKMLDVVTQLIGKKGADSMGLALNNLDVSRPIDISDGFDMSPRKDPDLDSISADKEADVAAEPPKLPPWNGFGSSKSRKTPKRRRRELTQHMPSFPRPAMVVNSRPLFETAGGGPRPFQPVAYYPRPINGQFPMFPFQSTSPIPPSIPIGPSMGMITQSPLHVVHKITASLGSLPVSQIPSPEPVENGLQSIEYSTEDFSNSGAQSGASSEEEQPNGGGDYMEFRDYGTVRGNGPFRTISGISAANAVPARRHITPSPMLRNTVWFSNNG